MAVGLGGLDQSYRDLDFPRVNTQALATPHVGSLLDYFKLILILEWPRVIVFVRFPRFSILGSARMPRWGLALTTFVSLCVLSKDDSARTALRLSGRRHVILA